MEGVVSPYTAEKRPDTGVSNGTLGIWLFLASEAMLFGALFSAYALLRTSAAEWPVGREVLHGRTTMLSTLFLVLGSVRAWQAVKSSAPAIKRRLASGTALAAGFLTVKGIEYANTIGAGHVPSTSMFFALYFTLTGFHAAHVLAGLVADVWALRGIARLPEDVTRGRVNALAIYWSFVDVVWLAILVVFYAF